LGGFPPSLCPMECAEFQAHPRPVPFFLLQSRKRRLWPGRKPEDKDPAFYPHEIGAQFQHGSPPFAILPVCLTSSPLLSPFHWSNKRKGSENGRMRSVNQAAKKLMNRPTTSQGEVAFGKLSSSSLAYPPPEGCEREPTNIKNAQAEPPYPYSQNRLAPPLSLLLPFSPWDIPEWAVELEGSDAHVLKRNPIAHPAKVPLMICHPAAHRSFFCSSNKIRRCLTGPPPGVGNCCSMSLHSSSQLPVPTFLPPHIRTNQTVGPR